MKRSAVPVLCSATSVSPEDSARTDALREGRDATGTRRPRDYRNPSGTKAISMFHKNKEPCPLCDEAKAALEPYRHRFELQEVDISLPENRVWLDRYRLHIPVFHLNGEFLMQHRVNTELLERRLEKICSPSPSGGSS
ncbi:glutaredoxin-like protein C5orf63 homolog [Puntigrus tetrazona]|uniref:glutaredoxin-like protein C5orf63 homolog n=1 Tax=Puntigrus tetrazona TaxID=1606681 RepID=UPI001C893F66|nr:glutaredoxin-like protein C5orf63 homolog [Puntigrus tetrazona]